MYINGRIYCIALLCLCLAGKVNCRGGRRSGKGKGKTNLQFAQVAEFSLIKNEMTDNRSASIITGSHFSQQYRLGYKLVLICTSRGDPRPTIKWFKEGAEMQPKNNVHYYERVLNNYDIWSKLEIDPTTMADQGIYQCVTHNHRGVMAKNFKAEYTY
uniref:Ig-like domain-containing protein n=1 Tax=Rhabditophanes sp. KR3021 TaxID=114890 RepID=A0AC35UD86_9BILA